MLALNIITIMFAITNITVSQILPNNMILPSVLNENTDEKVSSCIKQVTRDNIPCNSTVFFVSSKEYSERTLLRSINSYLCFTIVTRSFQGQGWMMYPDAYIIDAQNITDLLMGIAELSKDLSWNPVAKFVVLFNNIRSNEVLEIFEGLLQEMIYNVVLFTYTNNDVVEVLTYYPYSDNNCGRNASDIRSFGYCPEITENNFFPDKVPNGLRNCTLIVGAQEVIPFVMFNGSVYSKYLETGVEQYVLNTIAEYEGFQIKYKFVDLEEHFGVILPNRTGTGLVGYLQRKEVDLIAGGICVMGNRVEVFNFIYGHSYIMYSLYVPAFHEKRWTNVYRQFSCLTWVLIVLSFFFTVFVVLVTRALTLAKSKDEFLLMLKLWQYFYGQTDNSLIKDRYLKRIMIVWIIYTNIICAFYNTAFYSLITGHVADEIKIDLKHISRLPYKPCISDITRIFFAYAYNEIFPESVDNLRCQNTDEIFDVVANRNDLYTVETDYYYKLSAYKYLDDEYNPKISKLDYPRTIEVAMYVKKGFPLLKRFQDYALLIYEKGLLQRLVSHVFSKQPRKIPTLKRKYVVIRLVDFKIHYSILLIGAMVSFICFLIEYKTGNSSPGNTME